MECSDQETASTAEQPQKAEIDGLRAVRSSPFNRQSLKAERCYPRLHRG